jgi:hypothetical protein
MSLSLYVDLILKNASFFLVITKPNGYQATGLLFL